MEELTAWGFRDVALRIAKLKSYDGSMLLAYAYPTISIPTYKGPEPAPETALVLGIIRQETEFDATAVSGPGARGLMQVMPASAKRTSATAGLPYRPNDLSDPDYNMQLGMAELSGYLREWSGSYILSAASYNAGANNADRWATVFGDPRGATSDPVDWVENITFSETRNYVERVIENTENYRQRLAGRDVPLRILADLYGPAPHPAVIAYTPPANATDDPVPIPSPKPVSPTAASAGSAAASPMPKPKASGDP
jgi:soluble lytic murein transglycosylase